MPHAWLVKAKGDPTWWIIKAPPTDNNPATGMSPDDILVTIECTSTTFASCSGSSWTFIKGNENVIYTAVSLITQCTCSSDDQCNQRYAERCVATSAADSTKMCKHYGWVGFRTDKMYLHEDAGRFALKVERYGFANMNPPEV